MEGAGMNRWYAVRCCCNGEKLYGFLSLPEGPTRHEVHIVSEMARIIDEEIDRREKK
jgi:hypothetical protein